MASTAGGPDAARPRGLSGPRRADRGSGPLCPMHYTRFVSPIYGLARSDPFDRDIRVRVAVERPEPMPRAPVIRLADRAPDEAAALRALYTR